MLATAADIVADPSAHDAFVNGIMEGKEWCWEGGILREKAAEAAKRKINALVDGLTFNTPTPGALDLTTATDTQIINYYSNKNSIGTFLYNLKNKFGAYSVGRGSGVTSYNNRIAKSSDISTNVKADAVVITYIDKDRFYVRLGTLLQFFQQKLMYQIIINLYHTTITLPLLNQLLLFTIISHQYCISKRRCHIKLLYHCTHIAYTSQIT
jgi:hypothetical protein